MWQRDAAGDLTEPAPPRRPGGKRDAAPTEETHDRGRGPDRSAQPDLSLSDIAAFFSRQWRFVLALTAVVVVLTAVLVFVVLPRKYEAAATLVIVPPKFTSELKPATLTVQAYQQLLESDAAILETKRRLRAEAVLAEGDELRLGKELKTRIFVSRRSEETMLAPMLQVVAKWSAPEPAERIANTWARVFLEQTALLMDSSTKPTVRFVVEQFEARTESLTRLENERVEAANAYQRQYNALVDAWESKILAYRNDTADLLSAYAAETTRLIEDFRGETNFKASELRLEAMREAYSDLQIEQVNVDSRLQQKQLELAAFDEQVKANPPKLELRRSMPEEALWNTLAESEKDAWKRRLLELDLVTEVLNPVHTTMAHHRSETEAAVSALRPRSRQLAENLAALEQQVKELAAQVGANVAGLEKLNQERSAGRQRLREERNAGRAALERQKELELSAAEKVWEARREQLDRRIDVERNLSTELAQQHNEAILASAREEFDDVRLGSPAVAPESPMARKGALKLLLAASLGSVLALLIALFRDNLATARSPAATSGPATTSVQRIA